MHYHWFQVFTHLLTSSHGSRNKRIGVEGRPIRNSWPISKPMVTARGSYVLERLPIENGGFFKWESNKKFDLGEVPSRMIHQPASNPCV